jgi:hypothetical protein
VCCVAFIAFQFPDSYICNLNRQSLGSAPHTAHNFLEPQPVKDAAAFLVRYVVHDWSDTNLVIILTHLRAVAGRRRSLCVSHSPRVQILILFYFLLVLYVVRLQVIIENIAASACSSESTHPHASTIPILGVPRKPAAPPLLANYGMAGLPLYYYDLTVRHFRLASCFVLYFLCPKILSSHIPLLALSCFAPYPRLRASPWPLASLRLPRPFLFTCTPHSAHY